MRLSACHKLLCSVGILLILGFTNPLAAQNSERITLSLNNASFQKLIASIESQTSYRFVYTSEQLQETKPVTVSVKDTPLQAALDQCFQDQPLEFSLEEKYIILHEKPAGIKNEFIDITGIVKNENGDPLNGIAVTISGSRTGTSTDANGRFSLEKIPENVTLEFSGVNVEKRLITLHGQKMLEIVLKTKVNKIDEVQVIAYGTTTRRLSTGDISTVSAKEIEEQPVSNPLQALEGRVPGMYIQSNSGIAGNNLTIQIRGVNSIAAGNNPLYVIDGVPFSSGSLDLLSSNIGSTTTPNGLSPLNSINPNDIESISILKDADATAIYGSRAANGVVLITTKKGQIGKVKLDLNFYSGIEQVPHYIPMLNIQQYLQFRREAFANDDVIPTKENAPDLLVWDTTKNTNWQKQIIGGNAPVIDAQISLSGGSNKDRFLIGGSFHREGTVFPADISDHRMTGYMNLEHNSLDNKLYVNASVNYSIDKNNRSDDPTSYVNLPPNDPIYDSAGNLIFRDPYGQEPYSYLATKVNTQTNNLIANLNLRYTILHGLNIQCNGGYTQMDLNQTQMTPISGQNAALSPTGYTYFADNHLATWILEPQLNYTNKLGPGTIGIMAGGTWQQTTTQGKVIDAEGYNNDALLENIASADNISVVNSIYTQYDYASLFGRLNYNIEDKYILNGSFRRDGSSRFGPDKQFGNFGALGVAWIFSSEHFLQDNVSMLSFGKLHGSYGITGNDQIPDYQYLTTYSATTYSYQISGLRAARIANPDYSWETNKKLEMAIDLGFFKNRILLSAAWFQNRSGNQLVSYPLAGQSGFASYQSNLPALIQNTGWEISVNTINLNAGELKWSAGFNLTIPKNKLLEFPGLAGSSYGTANLIVGQPLDLVWGYHYLGVDPATGVAHVEDIDHDGVISYPGDYIPIGTNLPDFYGGLNNTFSYKNFQLGFLFQFTRKMAQSLRAAWYDGFPGTLNNQESWVSGRVWEQPGESTLLPKSTMNFPYYYALSDAGKLEDASYIKLKNISITYNLTGQWIKNAGISNLKIFLLGQNIFTITHYRGFDPEASGATVLPNLRVITAGFHCEF